jgi:hypothetical protein
MISMIIANLMLLIENFAPSRFDAPFPGDEASSLLPKRLGRGWSANRSAMKMVMCVRLAVTMAMPMAVGEMGAAQQVRVSQDL